MKQMKTGAIIVDVSIDQGGCVEGIKHTKHSDPIIKIENVNVYAVPNIPGAVPVTSTVALTNATLPYILKLAQKGFNAVFEDPALYKGVNVFNGNVVHEVVANALDLKCTSINK